MKANRGGQPGNTNTLRHGLKAGKLPPGCRYIEVRVCRLRRELEACVLAAKGQVNLQDASCVKSICDWERHRSLAQRWLRLHGIDGRPGRGKASTKGKAKEDTVRGLTPMEMLTFSRETARASTEMDKLIRLLGLDRDIVKDAWAVVDGTSMLLPPPTEDEPPEPQPDNASELEDK